MTAPASLPGHEEIIMSHDHQPPPALPEGVERVLTETFKVGGYTYTNLADAAAQARRVQNQAAGR